MKRLRVFDAQIEIQKNLRNFEKTRNRCATEKSDFFLYNTMARMSKISWQFPVILGYEKLVKSQ